MSFNDYKEARHLGRKEYQELVSQGKYPYLQVLDDVLRFEETKGEESLGLINIPMDHIVGTRTQGRSNAFAANFMPLLEEDSEFAQKWASLATVHVEGEIREPITAIEYMNRFYVCEGNKRVSVMKFFGVPSIPGIVKRIIPKSNDTPEGKIYEAFLEFYKLTKINYIWFSQPGRFSVLLNTVSNENYPWDDEFCSRFSSVYFKFKKVFKAMGGDRMTGTTGDAFLAYLKLHSMEEIRECDDVQLRAELKNCWSELAAYSVPQPVEIELDPKKDENVMSFLTNLTKMIPVIKPEALKVLFVYEGTPDETAWSHHHDQGRIWAEEQLKDKIETSYIENINSENGEEEIKKGIEQGADVVFITSAKLLPVCVKASVLYPNVKFLSCSLFSPHPTVRSYYGRMYEIKFLAGVLAGALTNSHKIGYLADYPIHGATAAINAFALGAKMTDPYAQVYVEWRATDGNLWDRLVSYGVDMISGYDTYSPVDVMKAHGLYQVSDGVGKQLCSWTWDWGKFYKQILENILDGNWKSPSGQEAPKATNYWWGLSAGVVNINYTTYIPNECLKLVLLLQQEIISGSFNPFDSSGLSPEEIATMDYLEKNVVGTIPPINELTEEAQELIKIQGIRDEDREEDT